MFQHTRGIIDLHHQLFIQLYELGVKPKFHHLHHVVDGMLYVGKLLSCFVTERKHRSSKASALHIFRNMEGTVLTDQINKMCESISEPDASLFKRTIFGGSSRHVIDGNHLARSTLALLECGEVKAGDIVWLNFDIVGKVVAFWRHDEFESFFVEIEALDLIRENGSDYYDESSSIKHFADATSIVDACVWVYKRAGILKVLVPFEARVR